MQEYIDLVYDLNGDLLAHTGESGLTVETDGDHHQIKLRFGDEVTGELTLWDSETDHGSPNRTRLLDRMRQSRSDLANKIHHLNGSAYAS